MLAGSAGSRERGRETAGLQIFSIANAHLPVEVGFFLPPEPTRRYGTLPARGLTGQSEDVLLDARGYIYLTNKKGEIAGPKDLDHNVSRRMVGAW